jgi:multicomponent Na+:H+ antiporter subunit C
VTGETLFGLCGAIVVGLGLYGVLVQPHPLRKVLAFNLLASGMFILFGVVAHRGAAAGFAGDPIPQALLITAIVVSFAATALVIALLLRLVAAGGVASLRPDAGTTPEAGPPEN